MYGKNRPTYESAATRRFQQGRTETCRSVSEDSVAWCRSMADESLDSEARAALFRKAVAAHIEYITAASDGKGVDRHLFGLKRLLEPGQEVPALYQDPAYGYSSSWYLSTSQLSSEYFNGYGWSQVIDDGFGIAYMINENRYVLFLPLIHPRLIFVSLRLANFLCVCSINFNIVSKGLGSDKMSFYLNEAAGDMRDMLMPSLEAPKAKI
jgi:carnitine O-acetyltransferase